MKRNPSFKERFGNIRKLLRLPRSPLEWFISVDHFPIWRTHLTHSHSNGGTLRKILVTRFSSIMVVLSLLLSIEVSTLYSPSDIGTEIRTALADDEFRNAKFWIGILILLDIIATFTAIIAAFTAWGMFSTVGDENIHFLMKSSIGLHSTQLPSRLLLVSAYLFFSWILLSVYVLVTSHGFWAEFIVCGALIMFCQIIFTYSALGNLIIQTRSMSDDPVFDGMSSNDDRVDTDPLMPFEMTSLLLQVVEANKSYNDRPESFYKPEQNNGFDIWVSYAKSGAENKV